MKALVLYFTALLSALLLMTEITPLWFILALVDIALITYLRSNITLKELIRYSGYDIWYKALS